MGLIPIRKKIIAVPARLNSSRLPKKLIADIGGKLMISRVLEQCKKSVPESNIVLCTDSEELSIIAKNLGINSLITSSSCSSGSERISSVTEELLKIAWQSDDFNKENSNDLNKIKEETLIINVQGDQPFLDPSVLDKISDFCLNSEKMPEVVTPVFKLSKDDIHNPAVVKTLLNKEKKAIYFSRAALPHIRDHEKKDWHLYCDYWGHVGIYGYRADILQNWKSYPVSYLEKNENLEQLRLIYSGIEISTFPVEGDFLSIDTFDQLEKAREICFKNKKEKYF